MQAEQRNTKHAARVMVTSWGESLRGNRREENEDAFLNWPEFGIWAVADGMGGSEHGAAASRFIIRSLMRRGAAESLEARISETRELLNDANEFLYQQGRVGGSAASTVVVLLIHEGEGACLWAGDSRCYLYRDDTLYQCTHDHTLRQHKIDTGELTPPEAYRMVKGNIVTSAVGVKAVMKLDHVKFSLRAGDRFLLCSDGLSNLLDGGTLSRALRRAGPKESAHSLLESLRFLTQPDNITFITTFLSRRL